MKVRIIKGNKIYHGGKLLPAGETVDVNKNIAIFWIEQKLAEKIEDDKDYPKNIGSSWYLLSNGKKVRGKKRAIKEQLGV